MKDIATYVRDTGMRTRIAKGHRCMSACAVIWSHGHNKRIHLESTVGFHVSSTYGTGVQDLIDAYGYMGYQAYVQRTFKDDILYYLTLPVSDPNRLAYQVLKHGYQSDKFWIPNEKQLKEIIGAEIL